MEVPAKTLGAPTTTLGAPTTCLGAPRSANHKTGSTNHNSGSANQKSVRMSNHCRAVWKNILFFGNTAVCLEIISTADYSTNFKTHEFGLYTDLCIFVSL
jgi:hypothetical protein